MIEIRELIIRATVDNGGDSIGRGENASEAPAAESQRLREAMEQVTSLLKEKNER